MDGHLEEVNAILFLSHITNSPMLRVIKMNISGDCALLGWEGMGQSTIGSVKRVVITVMSWVKPAESKRSWTVLCYSNLQHHHVHCSLLQKYKLQGTVFCPHPKSLTDSIQHLFLSQGILGEFRHSPRQFSFIPFGKWKISWYLLVFLIQLDQGKSWTFELGHLHSDQLSVETSLNSC